MKLAPCCESIREDTLHEHRRFQPFGFEHALNDTWFRRAKESEQIEGPRVTAMGHLCGEIAPGTLHPNRRGQQAIADQLYQHLAAGRTSRRNDAQERSLGLVRSETTYNGATDVLRRSSSAFLESTGGDTGNPSMNRRRANGVNADRLRARHEFRKIAH
jgi:hypothetical protein